MSSKPRGKAWWTPKDGAEIRFIDPEPALLFKHVHVKDPEPLPCGPMCPACIAGLPLYEMRRQWAVLPMWAMERLAWVDGEVQWVSAHVFGHGRHVTIQELRKLKEGVA